MTLKFLQQWDLPNYATGQVDRIYAMIALQMLVALSFLIMGATGIGRKLVDAVPMGIKAGIVSGAGVTAAVNVFSARMPKAPWTVAIAVLMSYFFLFNPTFARKATKSRFWNVVRNQGVVPAQLFAIILAPVLLHEIPAASDPVGLYPPELRLCSGALHHLRPGLPGLELLPGGDPLRAGDLHHRLLRLCTGEGSCCRGYRLPS